MILRDFLRRKTNALELCVITEDGWITATCWIDHEDLFCSNLSKELGEKEVKNDNWGYLAIVNENNETRKIQVHFIDV